MVLGHVLVIIHFREHGPRSIYYQETSYFSIHSYLTTYAISAYHHWCYEFESRSGKGVQHYVIKFVSDLRQDGSFLRILWCPPPIKLTATI
jgi:hypothetical protein